MRTVEKVSVALNLEELEWARQRADREGASLSAVLSAALRAARQAEARARLLQQLSADELPDDVLAEVKRELYGPRRASPRKAR